MSHSEEPKTEAVRSGDEKVNLPIAPLPKRTNEDGDDKPVADESGEGDEEEEDEEDEEEEEDDEDDEDEVSLTVERFVGSAGPSWGWS
jgi:hypothetical protein